jgi:hypothetical protein
MHIRYFSFLLLIISPAFLSAMESETFSIQNKLPRDINMRYTSHNNHKTSGIISEGTLPKNTLRSLPAAFGKDITTEITFFFPLHRPEEVKINIKNHRDLITIKKDSVYKNAIIIENSTTQLAHIFNQSIKEEL